MKFYSPYQFIPVTGKIHRRGEDGLIVRDPRHDAGPKDVDTTLYDDIAKGKTHVRHDRWQSDCLSGRLLCRLTTQGPVLVGAEQKPGAEGVPGVIENYRNRGLLAIPGSSLRGVAGAVAEALSQSALRVLDDNTYSVRKSMSDSLKAIGLLRKVGEEWRLLPLALTAVPVDKRGGRLGLHLEPRWLAVFPPGLPAGECLAAYFGDYRGEDDVPPDRFDCFQSNGHVPFVYSAQAVDRRLMNSDIGDRYELRGDQDPIQGMGRIAMRRALKDVAEDSGSFSVSPMRGVSYVLGWRRKNNVMPNKRREWFVPYAADWEARLAALRRDGTSTLAVPKHVIDTFETIAAARSADNRADAAVQDRLPFLPKGYAGRSPAREDGKAGFLRDGDLVYFDVDRDGCEVSEIAYSSIWREPIPGSAHGAFRQTAGADAVPWSQGRDRLTPAERLFGVVEENPRKTGRNLASRVRFSDALPVSEPSLLYTEEQGPQPLRQLQSPKPPSPAMYFRTADGQAVRKQEQSAKKRSFTDPRPGLDLGKHPPNGRKHFLAHSPVEIVGERPWETRLLESAAQLSEKDRIELLRDYARQGGRYGNPIDAGGELWFHVDFDNLTQPELDLLCTALDPKVSQLADPYKAGFEHKVGWGKPVGLGGVKVDLCGLFLVFRGSRYTAAGLRADRYPRRWVAAIDEDVRNRLAHSYPDEMRLRSNLPFEDGLTVGADLVDVEAFATLMHIGNPGIVDGPVSYPYLQNKQPYSEGEGFKWFVRNDHSHDDEYQYLEAVDTEAVATGQSGLPPLKPG